MTFLQSARDTGGEKLEIERVIRAPFPPAWVVRTLMAPLAWIGNRRGHAERYTPALAVA